jgi:hypothetical protein
MKFTVHEAKSPVKISSGSVAGRDLIPELKGKPFNAGNKTLRAKLPAGIFYWGFYF